MEVGKNVLKSTSGNRSGSLIMSLLALAISSGSLVSLYHTFPEPDDRVSTSAQYGATNWKLPSIGNGRGVQVLTREVNEMTPFVFTQKQGRHYIMRFSSSTHSLQYTISTDVHQQKHGTMAFQSGQNCQQFSWSNTHFYGQN